jgi:hypothetical protein
MTQILAEQNRVGLLACGRRLKGGKGAKGEKVRRRGLGSLLGQPDLRPEISDLRFEI